MDLRFSAADDVFRAEVRTWLEAHVPAEPLPSGDTADGFARHVEWEHLLFDARLAVVSWPEAFGGRAASLVQWLIFEEEYYRASAPSRVTQNGIFLLAPTLFEFGTPEQQQRILPAMASADVLWAQAWSEPNSGSDLASVATRAVRDDAAAGWRLTGQKTWCTRAAFCHKVFGLFRTDPDAQRHRGLTYMMVDLATPGVTVRPVERLDGDDGFAEIFFEDAFVPDADVIGDVHGGWSVAMATTSSERGLTLRSPGRFMATADKLLDLLSDSHHATDALTDAAVQSWIEAQAYRWYTFGTVTRMAQGRSMGAESSLNKIFWSELDVRMHETALALQGPAAELDDAWMRGFEFALAGPIYAGTNEIQRNVVARRVLDLPRK